MVSTDSMAPRIWLLAGPTASGKSALALRVAEAFDGEIVNADSMQIYHDLRHLTSRPTVEDELRIAHHLFGFTDAADAWSTGRWLRAAREVVEDIGARRRNVIVVGGTGLYFRALTQGLAQTPNVASNIRADAERAFAAMGEGAFRLRLAGVDPRAADRISPGDRQRLVRAWEVFAATRRSLSDHQASSDGGLQAGTWSALALSPPRADVYARCDARLEHMLAEGALAEVEALMARNLNPSLPILKAVGVREFAAHLRGEISLVQAMTAAQQETRRYAKRQMTWMRGQMTDWPQITGATAEAQWAQFLALTPS